MPNKLSTMSIELSWPRILQKLQTSEDLSRQETGWVLSQIMDESASESQKGAFLQGLRQKGETVEEIAGLVDVMLANAVQLETGTDALDIVGTGGDMASTVNVSSMASIVASSVGIPVMKHGSRSASGKTGSSEMFEALGINLDHTPARVAEIFKQVGLTFFFAPVFHPAMRHIAAARKELGTPTTFNFLGPLANPAQPIATALGVANSQVAPILAAEMATRGRTALVFRGNDGLDELTTTADSRLWQVCAGEVREFSLQLKKLGVPESRSSDLVGGGAETNAQIARDLFAGKQTGNLKAVRGIVTLNAAAGILAYELAKDPSRADVDIYLRFEDALTRANVAIDSGATQQKLDQWLEASRA